MASVEWFGLGLALLALAVMSATEYQMKRKGKRNMENTKTLLDLSKEGRSMTVGELRNLLRDLRDDAIVLHDPMGNGYTNGVTTIKIATVKAIPRKYGTMYRVQEKDDRGIPAVLID